MKKLMLALAVFTSLSAMAASKDLEIVKCSENGIGLESVIPGAEYQRSFYKGGVGLFAYDIGEPAAASMGIAITYYDPTEMPEGSVARLCGAITYLSGVNLKDAKSTYNATTGVTVKVPVSNYNPETGGTTPGMIEINIKSVNTGTLAEGHVIKARKLK